MRFNCKLSRVPELFYHITCGGSQLLIAFSCVAQELPTDKWFCCNDCLSIHLTMQKLVLKGLEVVPASVLHAINMKHVAKGLIDGAGNDIQWRILSGKSRNPDNLPLLSRAAAIFRVCSSLLFSVNL